MWVGFNAPTAMRKQYTIAEQMMVNDVTARIHHRCLSKKGVRESDFLLIQKYTMVHPNLDWDATLLYVNPKLTPRYLSHATRYMPLFHHGLRGFSE